MAVYIPMIQPIAQKDITVLTTMKTMVIADWFVEAHNPEEIQEALAFAKEKQLPHIFLGGGSNTVIVKSPLHAVVIKNRFQSMEVIADTNDTVDVKVGSGTVLSQLIRFCTEHGYSGLEYHRGLPGTVGGAIYMNSKWTKPTCYVGDPVIAATLLTSEGDIKTVDRDYFQFAYDYSILHETQEILLDVTFRLKKDDPTAIQERSSEALAHREATQPKGTHTCGCMFQNISQEEADQIGAPSLSAGRLIDLAGMKGQRVGSFVVSDQHANFILDDEGQGKPEDLLALIARVKEAVQKSSGLTLREEVVVIS